MNALKSLPPLESPTHKSKARKKTRAPLARRHSQQVKRSAVSHGASPFHQELAAEITVKLVFNGLLCVAATFGLVNLLSHRAFEQVKLQELETQVKATKTRVDRQKEYFQYNFAPQEAEKIMQEQTVKTTENQLKVRFFENKTN